MRQIRTCDFCGADATGVYEPLPEEFGENGPRLILCGACRDRLASVLDPLLDRLDVDRMASDGDSADGDSAGGDSADGDSADGDSAGGDSADGDSAGGDSAGGDSAGGDSAGGDPTETGDETTADASAGTASDSGSERASDSSPEESSETSTDMSPGEASEAGGRPVNERRGTPRGYRKVLRFLENREFPIDREEAEQLAADAYDLDPEAASAAIDHAVQYGRLSDVGGELRG